MDRDAYRGPQLPKHLLDQVGGTGKFRRDPSRKDRRKAERTEKKSARSKPTANRRISNPVRRAQVEESDADEDDDSKDGSTSRPPAPVKRAVAPPKPLKSILKAKRQTVQPEPEPEPSAGEETDHGSDGSFTISRQAAKAGLSDADAEIAALERKLGMKGKKGSKHVNDDELNWLVTGSDSEEEARGMKRKRPDDAKWLRDKRLKANRKGGPSDSDNGEGDSEVSVVEEHGANDESDDLENPFSEDELSGDDFDGLGSDDDKADQLPPPKPKRENPYVAPVVQTTTASIGKYVPPSLRKAATSDDEVLKQLRRQVNGQLNRLSEANMLSILESVEQIYVKNARQHVTSTLVDLLLSLISDPSTLNDTFIILHAGFAAALYKVIGTDFGAQLLEKLVETFDVQRSRQSTEDKQMLNILAFLSNLYAFQVVGSALIFDYVRVLLEELSESNTELLLRVIQSSGPQLRQDDPSALKDIVLLLQRNVADAGGEAKLPARIKFQLETINNLKNNRMKAGAVASAMAAEHTTRMKKVLGSLNTRSSLRATEPLRITLADIRDSEKKGKWWLIGASYNDPAKLAANGDAAPASGSSRPDDLDAGYESETPGHVNLHKLARQQGMNTDVRRAIFISILSSTDYKDAHLRLLKLHLKAKQELEIPRVLLHCIGAEPVYNPYYTLVARKVCTDDKKLQKAFQFALWDIFKRLGEATEGDNDEAVEEMGVTKIVNLAKLYGTLIFDDCLSISVLRTLEFAYLQPNTSMFVEVLFTTIMQQAHKKAAKDAEAFDSAIKSVFAQAQSSPAMLTGLQYFVTSTVSKAQLANGKREVRIVKDGCKVALETLATAVAEGAPASDDEDEESD